jgi:hypothetical protein
LSSNGKALGQLELPRAMRVYEVGRNHVLGLRLDELGVEHIDLFTFTRE